MKPRVCDEFIRQYQLMRGEPEHPTVAPAKPGPCLYYDFANLVDLVEALDPALVAPKEWSTDEIRTLMDEWNEHPPEASCLAFDSRVASMLKRTIKSVTSKRYRLKLIIG